MDWVRNLGRLGREEVQRRVLEKREGDEQKSEERKQRGRDIKEEKSGKID